jgi:hypothetical protein
MRALALCALVSSAAAAQDGTKFLDPIRYRQLTVIPIARAGDAGKGAHYLTLREGLAKKIVQVSEKPDGAEVNRVLVRNESDRPLLLIGGEMILGGQQDRILGKDTVIAPRHSALVEVFCVEHGRWSGARQFGAAGGMVAPSVRAQAKYAGDQQRVWSEVAAKTGALGAASSTGTYRAIGEKSQASIAPYREHIRPALEKLTGIVGVAAAVNGRIVSVDRFAAPELFAQYRDQILDSIFVAAAGVPEQSGAAAVTPAQVVDFVQKVRAARPKVDSQNEAGKTERRDAKGVSSFALVPKDAAEPVYESTMSLEK